MPTNSLRLIRSLFSLPSARVAPGYRRPGVFSRVAHPRCLAGRGEMRETAELGQLTTAEQAGGLKAALPFTVTGTHNRLKLSNAGVWWGLSLAPQQGRQWGLSP